MDFLDEQGVQLDNNDIDTAEDHAMDKFFNFLRGNSGQCNCNHSKDCRSGYYCKQGSCATPRSGTAYKYGQCVANDRNVGRACNYKQCTNKSNGSCECTNGARCVKGNEKGSNTCNTSGDKNGCCIAFVLEGSEEEE